MWEILTPLLLLAGAGALWAIGFHKIPVLLGLAALVTGLAAAGFKKPEEVGFVVVLVGVAVFWIGMLSYLAYMKLKLRSLQREAEARKRASLS